MSLDPDSIAYARSEERMERCIDKATVKFWERADGNGARLGNDELMAAIIDEMAASHYRMRELRNEASSREERKRWELDEKQSAYDAIQRLIERSFDEVIQDMATDYYNEK